MYKLEYDTANGPVEESFDNFEDAKNQVDYLRENKTRVRNVEGQELVDYINQTSKSQES